MIHVHICLWNTEFNCGFVLYLGGVVFHKKNSKKI